MGQCPAKHVQRFAASFNPAGIVGNWLVIGGSSGAAARLGLKRTTLIAKMKKFGISRPMPSDDRGVLTDGFEGGPAPSCG